jgi:hypothetical protein
MTSYCHQGSNKDAIKPMSRGSMSLSLGKTKTTRDVIL